MPIKGIIFDWDGVMLDSIKIVYSGMRAVFNHFGVKPPSLTNFHKNYRQPFSHYYKKFGINADDAELRRIYFLAADTGRAEIFPEFKEILSALKFLNLPVAIISSHPRDLIIKRLERDNLEKEFAVIVGLAFDKVEPILDVCSCFGAKPEEVIFVGDMLSDMRDGKNAEVCAVGFDGGYGHYRALIKAGAEHCICRHAQILSIILKK
ncbi:MAG: HAD family hydrolase [Patescibacteria group bacterium]